MVCLFALLAFLLMSSSSRAVVAPVDGFQQSTIPMARQIVGTRRPPPSSSSLLVSSGSAPPRRQTRDALDRAGGLVYRTGVFTPAEYSIIANEASAWSTSLRAETTSSVARHRLGVALPPASTASPTVRLLQDPRNSLTALVQKLTTGEGGGDGGEARCYQLSPHIPVEIRSYERPGAGMAWHVDDVLCDPPQIEVVYTLENTSDCVTLWKVETNHNSNNNHHHATAAAEVHGRETDRNSALLLRAGRTPHCVTGLKRPGGRRVILKCAYATADAVYHSNNDKNNKNVGKPQFGTTTRAKAATAARKKRRRKKR